MSAYICTPETIGYVASKTGLSVKALASLNLRSVCWYYKMTPGQAVKEFLGYRTLKHFVDDCLQAEKNPPERGDVRIDIAELMYQSCDLDACVESETYQALRRIFNGN